MSEDLVIGGQLGNYLIDSVIGRGGMSVVYQAKHSRLGTSVALKVLAAELSSDDTFRERFLREAQMAAGIEHPNVIPIYDTGLHENSLYIVMRYIAGGDLRTMLAAAGPLDAQRALALLMPVARALDAAHAKGLVHRDVKPGNILLQRSEAGEVEHVFLTDFGIAKSASSVSRLTRAGGLVGTLEYMSPEQTEGRDVGAQTDVYALAGVFYECLTGRTPFERELAEGAWPPVRDPEPVSSLRPELPAALDEVVAKGLSRSPSDRYATCEQFLHACTYVLEARAPGVGGPAGATVAEPSRPAMETAVPASAPPPPGGAGPDHEPAAGNGGDSWPPADAQPVPIARKPERPALGARLARQRRYGALLLAVIVAIVAVVVLTKSSSTKAGKLSTSTLAQVPTNHVTGSGNATVRLNGDVASVTVATNALDYNDSLVHPFHIHAGGKGQCPPASAARPHNGHLTISTTDGIKFYGPPVQALTTRGDTSPASILAFPRYLTGGTLHYSRTITLSASVASDIRQNNAVIVVHGVDYDHSGIYSGALERSELNKGVPATATAPALCGALVSSQKVAALGPRSRAHTLVYTASLVLSTAAPSVPSGELFFCEGGGATAGVAQARRQASARSPARA